jgi:hypothetical protein
MHDIVLLSAVLFAICWIKNVILEKTKVLFAMENNLYL